MSIVAKYNMNWNSNDTSWNSNNWTDTSVTYVEWKAGQWASYTVWSFTSVADSSSLDLTTDVNIELLFKIDTWVAYSWLVYKWIDNGTIEQNYTLDSWLNWLNPRFVFYNSAFKIFQLNITLTTWKWYHLALKHTFWSWSLTKWTLNWNNASWSWTLWTWNESGVANTRALFLGDLGKTTWEYSLNWVIDEVIINNLAQSQAKMKNKYAYYNWFI